MFPEVLIRLSKKMRLSLFKNVRYNALLCLKSFENSMARGNKSFCVAWKKKTFFISMSFFFYFPWFNLPSLSTKARKTFPCFGAWCYGNKESFVFLCLLLRKKKFLQHAWRQWKKNKCCSDDTKKKDAVNLNFLKQKFFLCHHVWVFKVFFFWKNWQDVDDTMKSSVFIHFSQNFSCK